MSTLQKRPTFLQKTFGVNAAGHSFPIAFLNNLAAASWEDTRTTDRRIWFGMVCASAMVGSLAYGFAQMFEHGRFNDRPDLDVSHYYGPEDGISASLITINDRIEDVRKFGGEDGSSPFGTFLVMRDEETGHYAISECWDRPSSSYKNHIGCEMPLTADAVRNTRLNVEELLREVAEDEMSSGWFSGQSSENEAADQPPLEDRIKEIQSRLVYAYSDLRVSEPLQSESPHGFEMIIKEPKFYVKGFFFKNNDDRLIPLSSSMYPQSEVSRITSLWDDALNSPDNGAYNPSAILQGEPGIWQRTEDGEWDDAWLGKNWLGNVAMTFGMMIAALGVAPQVPRAWKKTKNNNRQVKGLDRLYLDLDR